MRAYFVFPKIARFLLQLAPLHRTAPGHAGLRDWRPAAGEGQSHKTRTAPRFCLQVYRRSVLGTEALEAFVTLFETFSYYYRDSASMGRGVLGDPDKRLSLFCFCL